MTTLPERLLELAADFDTCIPFLPEPGQRNIAARTKELRDLAATALQSPALSGEVVAYWVPNARVMSDGSYEDGPGYLVPIDEATQHERQHGTPLYLASHSPPIAARSDLAA